MIYVNNTDQKSFVCIILIPCLKIRFFSRGATLTFDYRVSDFKVHKFDYYGHKSGN